MYDHEESNYQNDSRVLAGERAAKRRFDEKRMVLTFSLSEEEGHDGDVELPARYEVCPTCDGKGTHVNPSIDASGITASDWQDWDEDEQEGYFAGSYDVTCYDCGGKRVVPVIDEDQAKAKDPAILKLVQEQQKEDIAFERMAAMERSMGA